MCSRKVVGGVLCVAVGLSVAWVLASCARRQAHGERTEVVAMAFSSEGNSLVGVVRKVQWKPEEGGKHYSESTTGGAELRAWNLRTGEAKSVLAHYDAYPWLTAFSADGTTVAIGNQQDAYLFDANTGTLKRDFKGRPFFWYERTQRNYQNNRDMALSPDGATLAIVTQASDSLTMLRLCDVKTGAVKRTLMSDRSAAVYRPVFAQDGKTLAALGDKVRLWDVSTGKLKRTMNLSPIALGLSPDGKTLTVVGVGGNGVQLWDVESGNKLREVWAVGLSPEVALSPDGKLLAGRMPPCVWDLQTGARGDMLGHEIGSKSFTSVAFSRDGRTLASASTDETIRLWDVRTMKATRAIRVTATPQHKGK